MSGLPIRWEDISPEDFDTNDSVPDSTGWEDMRHDGTAYLEDNEPRSGVYEYCEGCGKHGQPMAADSIWCESCEKRREQEGR